MKELRAHETQMLFLRRMWAPEETGGEIKVLSVPLPRFQSPSSMEHAGEGPWQASKTLNLLRIVGLISFSNASSLQKKEIRSPHRDLLPENLTASWATGTKFHFLTFPQEVAGVSIKEIWRVKRDAVIIQLQSQSPLNSISHFI